MTNETPDNVYELHPTQHILSEGERSAVDLTENNFYEYNQAASRYRKLRNTIGASAASVAIGLGAAHGTDALKVSPEAGAVLIVGELGAGLACWNRHKHMKLMLRRARGMALIAGQIHESNNMEPPEWAREIHESRDL